MVGSIDGGIFGGKFGKLGEIRTGWINLTPDVGTDDALDLGTERKGNSVANTGGDWMSILGNFEERDRRKG